METQRDHLLTLLGDFGIVPTDTTGWQSADIGEHDVVLATGPDDAYAHFRFDAAGDFVELRVVES